MSHYTALMAESTPSNDTESCCFQRTVTLYDWWLVKSQNDFQGRRLAVAGVSSRKSEALRVFVSAPVVKRYDVFSLETADGKCVMISGFINEQRTLDNGFAPEVFNCFLYGFPPNWESYALDCFRDESTAGTDLGSAVPDNVSATWPDILSDGVENSGSTSLASQKEALEDYEKSFSINVCNLSKDMGGVNVACSSGGKRRRARLHDVKVCQQKELASGGLPKHPDNEESSTSVALENCDAEGLKSQVTPIQSKPWSEYSNDACVENSIPTLASQKEVQGDYKKSFHINECNWSKEKDGVNVACSSGGKRRSARLHDIKICQQKKQLASGGLLKHPDNEKNSTSVALESCDAEGLKSPAAPTQSQRWSEYSNDACVENFIPTSLASQKEASGDRTKSFHINECNLSKEMGEINAASSSGGKRRSARLHDIKLFHKEKHPSCGGPPKHPDNENSMSVTPENCEVEGLKSPATPIQSYSWRQPSTSHGQVVKKSASRISSTLSPKTDGCYKKKRVTIETKVVRLKGKRNKSSSAVNNLREKDPSHLTKGDQQNISIGSPVSLSFRKSRSGRLLLPPLEFWRNQIPIYNADHELTEIQDGASLISPCRVSSPSLSRFNTHKRAA